MGHPRRKATPQLKARTTRSSRGRLLSLSDPAQTSQRLDDQLRALGLYAAPTLGDGNCLFRALSDQLYGTDSKHALLRQHICDWIQHHKSRYEPFVEDERGIDTHLHCMRENATYGGHMELSAFAHMAQRNVKVVQPGLVYVIEWQAFAVSSSPTTPSLPDKEDLDGNDDEDDPHSSIYVAYHDWEHFSSIRNLKGPHVGLPRVKERPVSQTDLPPSPITDHYKPAKERKRVGKDRDRERQERRREKAREKIKGKHIPTTVVESETDDDDEPEISSSSPEKLKIKLKLTLNNHTHSPSSSLSNISETDNNKSPQKTGLKLRLPPSRSISVAPSTLSTPPNSSQTSISEIYPSIAEALPHANPPTHTAAPHLVSNSRESSPGTGEGEGGGRINQSPKRTFEESEIEDERMMNGGRGVRSRLCVGDDDDEEDNVTTTTATTTTTTASSSTLSSSPESSSSSPPSPPCLEKDDEHLLVSPDDTIMISPTTPTASSTVNNLDTSLQQQRTQRKQQQCRSIHSQSSSSSIVPCSSSSPKSSSSSSTSSSTISTSTSSPYMTTRQQKKREVSNNTNQQQQQQHRNNNNGGGGGGGGRMLTRRQRKALGLPKLRKRRVGPYDRTEGGGEGKEGGEEWKKNGTGRVDVRGFRELKI